MKILITGACGFVGSSIIKVWKEEGLNHEILGFDNLIRPGSELNRRFLKQWGVPLFHGDIRIPSDFETLPAVDWIIDAAANPSVLAGIDGQTSSRQTIEHNLMGTLNMLEFCKVQKAGFILLSTSRVYSIKSLESLTVKAKNEAFYPKKSSSWPQGLSLKGVNEDFSTRPPLSLYGTSKLVSEALALEYGEIFNFPVFINRCGVLSGAGQFGRAEQGIFSYWIHAWREKRPLRYIGFNGKGYQVRDCLHPRDLASLLEKQIRSPKNSALKILNVSGGLENSMSLAQLSSWCGERLGENTVKADPRNRPFDIPWMVLDSSRAQKAWNWKPQVKIQNILSEIAKFAQANPDWSQICR